MTCTRMFLEDSAIIVKNYKILHAHQGWASCGISYNGTQLRSETKWLTDTKINMNESTYIMLSERSWPRKNTFCMIPLIWTSGINNITYDNSCRKIVGSGTREYFISIVSSS